MSSLFFGCGGTAFGVCVLMLAFKWHPAEVLALFIIIAGLGELFDKETK